MPLGIEPSFWGVFPTRTGSWYLVSWPGSRFLGNSFPGGPPDKDFFIIAPFLQGR